MLQPGIAQGEDLDVARLDQLARKGRVCNLARKRVVWDKVVRVSGWAEQREDIVLLEAGPEMEEGSEEED